MRRLLVANRGEIARRILRTARGRGMRVAVVSTPADVSAPVRREADDVLEVPSFLDGKGIVAAARRWGADLVHPGYGYLSESAEFAAAVEGAGIRFVGPTAEGMRALGGKETARSLAAELGVPTLRALSSAELSRLAPGSWPAALAVRGIEPPYLVKASAGGGGRGMRLVADPAHLEDAVVRASEEARSAFGDGSVFVERLLEMARHVEIQVFGDGEGGGVFWGERECSLQRRHQKLFEEAPSSGVTPELREALGRAALGLVRAARYRGAGTVEFLLDRAGRFFFLEVNTRLQVEHPVTEQVYGVDLVGAQLDLAEGGWPEGFPSPRSFLVPTPRGQAFEARVLAEEPRRGFLPAPGVVRRYLEPFGEGVRVDSGIGAGSEVGTAFDSLLAKVITHADDRAGALDRMAGALEAFVIHGCGTNLPFLHALALDPDVRAGRFHTRWIDEHASDLNAPRVPEALGGFLGSPALAGRIAEALDGGPENEPREHVVRFARQAPAFPSFAGLALAPLRVACLDAHGRLQVSGPALNAALVESGTAGPPRAASLQALLARAAGEGEPALELTATRVAPETLAATAWGETWRLVDLRAAAAARGRADGGRVEAPMAGTVIEVRVSAGDVVEQGQVLFVLESMKMQLEVTSPASGVVEDVFVRPGEVLEGPGVLALVSVAAPPAPADQEVP